jgi:hypothetical protein
MPNPRKLHSTGCYDLLHGWWGLVISLVQGMGAASASWSSSTGRLPWNP